MGMRISDVRQLAASLERVSTWLRRQGSPSVSSTTLSALDRLTSGGPLRVSELAAAEAISQPGVTVLVNRMAESGWAERVPDPTDRRATLVRATESGAQVLARRYAARAELLRSRIAELGDEDQALLTAALPALERLVAAAPGASAERGAETDERGVTRR